MCKLISTKDGYELQVCNVYKHLAGALIRHAESCRNVQGSDDVLGQAVEDLLKKMQNKSSTFKLTVQDLIEKK